MVCTDRNPYACITMLTPAGYVPGVCSAICILAIKPIVVIKYDYFYTWLNIAHLNTCTFVQTKVGSGRFLPCKCLKIEYIVALLLVFLIYYSAGLSENTILFKFINHCRNYITLF